MTNNIQWFPGHMKKAQRLIEENLKNINLIIELLDARIPRASSNPLIKEITKRKKIIKVLTKSDLADNDVTNRWIEYFNNKKIPVVAVDLKNGKGIDLLLKVIKEENNTIARCMMVGVPNVGKSTLINRLSGQNRAKTENKPGVTRERFWIQVNKDLELIDMPGLTWNKFENEKISHLLAITGAIKEEIFDSEQVAIYLINILIENYKNIFENKYNIDINKIDLKEEDGSLIDPKIEFGYEILKEIARSRGYLLRGGEEDTQRASKSLLNDFRSAKIGRISLEKNEE